MSTQKPKQQSKEINQEICGDAKAAVKVRAVWQQVSSKPCSILHYFEKPGQSTTEGNIPSFVSTNPLPIPEFPVNKLTARRVRYSVRLTVGSSLMCIWDCCRFISSSSVGYVTLPKWVLGTSSKGSDGGGGSSTRARLKSRTTAYDVWERSQAIYRSRQLILQHFTNRTEYSYQTEYTCSPLKQTNKK